MSEPRRGGEERRKFVEELERRTEHAKRLLDEIGRRRQEAERQGLTFTAPTAEQLLKKLDRTESPMIVGEGWVNSTTPGGVISYVVDINNPDPISWSPLYVHVFVGLANLTPNVGAAVAAVDPRFPRLTMPHIFGLSLDPGTTQSVSFSITVPQGVERTNYLGNAILFQGDFFDVGTYLDRGLFVFEVT